MGQEAAVISLMRAGSVGVSATTVLGIVAPPTSQRVRGSDKVSVRPKVGDFGEVLRNSNPVGENR
jgi:hypothetical protein